MKEREENSKRYTLKYKPHVVNAVAGARAVAQVAFGFLSPDNDLSVVAVTWHNMGSEDTPSIVPRLECWCSNWHTLSQLKDVIDALAEVDRENMSPEEFCQILERLGFQQR